LFFLGHMAWAYIWAMMLAGKLRGKLFIHTVLMFGVVPDVDILLQGFGVVHHTFTHSLFFWLVMFAPFFAVFGRKLIPYFVAVAQHFVFEDFLVGKVMMFWPFSLSYFGFHITMPSILDVALEIAGLLLAAAVAYFSGDLKRLLSLDTQNSLMFLPFLALVTSMLFYAVDWPIIPLIAYVGSSHLLATLVWAHIVLTIFLAVSTAQGLRNLFKPRDRN